MAFRNTDVIADIRLLRCLASGADGRQTRNVQTAANDPTLSLNNNHGHPTIAATAHPAQFNGPGVIAAHPGKPIAAVAPQGHSVVSPGNAATVPGGKVSPAATIPGTKVGPGNGPTTPKTRTALGCESVLATLEKPEPRRVSS